jgi:benzodiazapine receptor
MKTRTFTTISMCIAFVAMIAVNALAILLPLNGKTTKELSDKYFSDLTPAAYTFSVWNVIYLLLLGFVLRVAFAKKESADFNGLIDKIINWFSLSCVLNGAWIVAWHFEKIGMSMLIMLALLFVLVKIYTTIQATYLQESKLNNFTFYFPFSVYLAWICAAAIADFAAFLVSIHWKQPSFGNIEWAGIMLFIVLLVALVFVFTFKDKLFAITILWAFAGIGVQQYQRNNTFNVVLEVDIICFVLLLAALLSSVRQMKTMNLLPAVNTQYKQLKGKPSYFMNN